MIENTAVAVMKSISLVLAGNHEKYSIPLKIKKNKISMTVPISAP